ncbi:hypothetical protein RHGRI_029655 [Rhododendron griersonianum]|uniref:Uncharacterized protein n=1 Tax=Rhododendron griersonianum TaxID=479676 RepID=A0AAV6IMG7_9ERIC|nr:hypothetical protein RHGRI_029655 [Rhododendron griersonianum]
MRVRDASTNQITTSARLRSSDGTWVISNRFVEPRWRMKQGWVRDVESGEDHMGSGEGRRRCAEAGSEVLRSVGTRLHGLGFLLHQLGFQQICLSSLTGSTTREYNQLRQAKVT